MSKKKSSRNRRRKTTVVVKQVFVGNENKTLEQPIFDEQEEFTKSFLINSGPQDTQEEFISTEEREFKNISTADTPVEWGSAVTDYDGIQSTINWASSAYVRVKAKLEWAVHTLRQMEKQLHQKDCQIAELRGLQAPKPLKTIPFIDEPTDPGTVILIQRKEVNRMGMIWVGAISGAFVLMCIYELMFGKK